MPLAIESYRHFGPLRDDGATLQLGWTCDERALLSISLDALARDCLRDELAGRADSLQRYLVTDPYGSATLGPGVESYFGLPGLAENLTCGAGVNALLHALSGLGRDLRACIADAVYPDFPHWLALAGAQPHPLRLDSPEVRGALAFLERPAFIGEGWNALPALLALCRSVGEEGVVVVDESNANYCPPAFSAAPLTAQAPNLVVLRGLSKAYGMGSLRVGYAISSPRLTARVRALVPGLQASSLSLTVARRILEAGDVAVQLRARIAIARTASRALFAPWADALAAPAGEGLPYLLLKSVPAALTSPSAAIRLATKRHMLWAAGQNSHAIHRCSVPLDPARWERLARLVAAARETPDEPDAAPPNRSLAP